MLRRLFIFQSINRMDYEESIKNMNQNKKSNKI